MAALTGIIGALMLPAGGHGGSIGEVLLIPGRDGKHDPSPQSVMTTVKGHGTPCSSVSLLTNKQIMSLYRNVHVFSIVIPVDKFHKLLECFQVMGVDLRRLIMQYFSAVTAIVTGSLLPDS